MNDASPGRSITSKRTSSRCATSSKQASASFSDAVFCRKHRHVVGGDRRVVGGLLAAAVAAEAARQHRQVFRMLALDDLLYLERAGVDREPALPGVAHAQKTDDLGRVGMQVELAIGRVAARGLLDIGDVAEIVAIGALRAAQPEM